MALRWIAPLFFLFIIAGATGLGSGGSWDRWDNIRVTGHLIDARTGEPAAGVEILTLWQASNADGEPSIKEIRDMALRDVEMIESGRAAGHDMVGCCPIYGIGLTDADGRFDICTGVLYGGTDNGWGCRSKSHTPPPYHGVQALLVTWPDGRREVLDATIGRYTVVNEAGIYALIDMGVVRVETE